MREFWTDTLEHVTVFDLVLTARQVLSIICRDDRAFENFEERRRFQVMHNTTTSQLLFLAYSGEMERRF